MPSSILRARRRVNKPPSKVFRNRVSVPLWYKLLFPKGVYLTPGILVRRPVIPPSQLTITGEVFQSPMGQTPFSNKGVYVTPGILVRRRLRALRWCIRYDARFSPFTGILVRRQLQGRSRLPQKPWFQSPYGDFGTPT